MDTPSNNTVYAAHPVTVHFSDREQSILERLAAERHLTVEQVLRVALATYQEVETYRKEGGRFPVSRRGEPRGAGLAE